MKPQYVQLDFETAHCAVLTKSFTSGVCSQQKNELFTPVDVTNVRKLVTNVKIAKTDPNIHLLREIATRDTGLCPF